MNYLVGLVALMLVNSFFVTMLFIPAQLAAGSVFIAKVIVNLFKVERSALYLLSAFVFLALIPFLANIDQQENVKSMIVVFFGMMLGYLVSTRSLKLKFGLAWAPLVLSFLLFLFRLHEVGDVTQIF